MNKIWIYIGCLLVIPIVVLSIFSINETSPTDGATGVSTNPILNVTFGDADSDDANITFFSGCQWTLTPTINYTNKFATTGEGTNSIWWHPHGIILYTSELYEDKFFQYNCSTAWDVSTCSYASNISVRDINSHGITFNDDGTIMFDVGESSIAGYDCTTAWELSTCSYNSQLIDFTASEGSEPRDIEFSENGTYAYISSYGTNQLLQYECSIDYNLSSCSYTGDSISINKIQASKINYDGSKLWTLNISSETLNEYSCSNNWNLSSCINTNRTFINFNGDVRDFYINSTYINYDSVNGMINGYLNTSHFKLYYPDADLFNIGVADDWVYEYDTLHEIGSDNDVRHGGEATMTWSGLDNNKTYYWYAYGIDSNNSADGDLTDDKTVYDCFTFTTNTIPYYTINSPLNESTNLSKSPILNATLYDDDGHSLSYSFYTINSTGSNIEECTGSSIASGTIVTCTLTDKSFSEQITWFINVSDTLGESVTSGNYNFYIHDEPLVSYNNITPINAISTQNITFNATCIDNESSSMTAYLNIYKNTVLINSTNNVVQNNTNNELFTLDYSNYVRNDNITSEVFCYDGYDNGTKNNYTINIGNSVSTVTDVTILPASPDTSNNLTFTNTTTDEDSDTITDWSFIWYKNGIRLNSYNNVTQLNSTNTSFNDNFTISLSAYDGYAWSTYTNSTTTTIGDSTAPSFLSFTIPSSITVSTIINISTIIYEINSIDYVIMGITDPNGVATNFTMTLINTSGNNYTYSKTYTPSLTGTHNVSFYSGDGSGNTFENLTAGSFSSISATTTGGGGGGGGSAEKMECNILINPTEIFISSKTKTIQIFNNDSIAYIPSLQIPDTLKEYITFTLPVTVIQPQQYGEINIVLKDQFIDISDEIVITSSQCSDIIVPIEISKQQLNIEFLSKEVFSIGSFIVTNFILLLISLGCAMLLVFINKKRPMGLQFIIITGIPFLTLLLFNLIF